MLLDRFRGIHTLGKDVKLTYAGRLDPMAEGLVLVLAGESRFQKDMLLGLPKTYIVEVLLGIASDTLDVLGLITQIDIKQTKVSSLEKAVQDMAGVTELPYPMFSSVPVNGKPLFMHAREGNTVHIPQKKISIYGVTLISVQKEAVSTLAQRAISDIGKVVGDFRQEPIIEKWKTLLNEHTEAQLVTLEINASSGTYMRSLAQWLGEQLSVPAIAYTINRVSLGEYEIKNTTF